MSVAIKNLNGRCARGVGACRASQRPPRYSEMTRWIGLARAGPTLWNNFEEKIARAALAFGSASRSASRTSPSWACAAPAALAASAPANNSDAYVQL
jgi:hypothetical protein